jgi:dephospho-CoA kinase
MINLKIIAFTGMPFSGKTEAVQIAKDKGIPIIRMGDMVWDEVKKRGLELSDKNVGFIANEMRKKHGKNIWATRTIEKIKSMTDINSIIIDGVRNVEEIDVFKKELGEEFIVIAIEVSDKTRHERAMTRDRKDDSKNIEKIKERDQRELGWGLGSLIASADIVVTNEGNVDDFKKHVKDVLEEL